MKIDNRGKGILKETRDGSLHSDLFSAYFAKPASGHFLCCSDLPRFSSSSFASFASVESASSFAAIRLRLPQAKKNVLLISNNLQNLGPEFSGLPPSFLLFR